MSRHYKVAIASAFIIGISFGAPGFLAAQLPFTVIALPETSATFPAGTALSNPPFTSETADPTGFFSNESVWFEGFEDGGSGETNAAGGHLIYRMKVVFNQPVNLDSITVSGVGDYLSCGGGPMLRLLDSTETVVLAALSTQGLPSGPLNTYTLTPNQVAGQTFFVDEFDCSTNGRFRSSIAISSESTGCQVKATNVTMFDSHTLEVDLTGQFSTNPLTSKSLSVSSNINGIPVGSVFPLPPGSTGSQSQALFIDLSNPQNPVPRFTDNIHFKVLAGINEGGIACAASPQSAVVLLPVVIVPGIGIGDGRFPRLEDFLATAIGNGILDQAYALQGDSTGYPTLFTLSYDRNHDSFLNGALKLSTLIGQINSLTYADSVNLLTHSKGALVARAFVSEMSGPIPVSQLIMAEPPNLGALSAAWTTILPRSIVNLSNLVPTWPWHQRTSSLPFEEIPPNPELDKLNELQMPQGPIYTLLYSTSNPTYWTETGRRRHRTFSDVSGDGVVTAFSMLGLKPNPNDPSQPPVLIPAFQSLSINAIEIDGPHLSYLQQQNVMNEVGTLLTK
jgi:hypothetical protein